MIPSVSLPLSETVVEAHAPRLSALSQRYARENALHSTLLFTGMDGVGKKSTVLYLIQTLFCDESIYAGKSLNRPCGECRSCKRALQNQWLDLHWFEPESKDEDRFGTHKIETFRELKSKLGLGATEEPFKVVVIADADRMTTAAANSILKMLEEPPPGWIFILTAADASRLLPTILSRCLEIKLQPLSPSQVLSVLKDSLGSDFQSSKAEVAARASLGSIRRAQVFLEDDTWKLRDLILGLLSHPAAEWMKLVDQISSNQKTMSLGLDLLESLFYDLMMNQITPYHSWIHQDQKAFLQQWSSSKQIQLHEIQNLLSKIADFRRLVSLTLNSKLLAQQILTPVLRPILSR
jgi:DNA polymerase-3 subunit delta'